MYFLNCCFLSSNVHINATLDFYHMQTSSRSISCFFQRNNSFGVFNAYLSCLFVFLLQEYQNELLGMSCTCACICLHATLLDLHLWRFSLTYFCTLSHLVYNCISMHQCLCGVFLLLQYLCIVYLCCSAYQNHLSFFTFRILQCCLLHDQCFPQLVSFPAIFFGANGNIVKQER